VREAERGVLIVDGDAETLARLVAQLESSGCRLSYGLGGPEDAAAPKNPHAAALGRLGGLVGGRVRAERLTARRRQAIARKAARARWAKTRRHS
jgi:hypothetical protein